MCLETLWRPLRPKLTNSFAWRPNLKGFLASKAKIKRDSALDAQNPQNLGYRAPNKSTLFSPDQHKGQFGKNCDGGEDKEEACLRGLEAQVVEILAGQAIIKDGQIRIEANQVIL